MRLKEEKELKKWLMGFVLVGTLFLAGCQMIDNLFLDIKEEVTGISGTIQTYDEESRIIDQIKGKSVAFSANNKFSDEEGNGSVLDVTVSGKQVTHVGSTLLFYEDGLTNVFDEFAEKVDIETMDRAVPMVNRMVNEFENTYFGTEKVILIRSQSGNPLATFAGDNVSIDRMEVDKMTKITIDGKRIYIYRADYTIYDTSLLN